jgi:hypothetical protein
MYSKEKPENIKNVESAAHSRGSDVLVYTAM